MKNILLFFIGVLFMNFVNATNQVPDKLFYNNQEHTLDTGWGHPSPLETYYQQSGIKYPFSMLSTANYRGFVATWKIEDGKFYITKININDTSFLPKKFSVASKSVSFSKENQVFADWFSGVIIGRKRNSEDRWEVEYSVYFYIKNGVIQRSEKITDEDLKVISESENFDDLSAEMKLKNELLYLNQSYISYYFRQSDNEEIIIGNKVGKLRGKNGGSVILEYFDNDHLKWPYNWENMEMNGAPNGAFKIIDDTLYVMEVTVHTGLDFENPMVHKVMMSSIFEQAFDDSKIVASWMNGIYMVVHEKEVEDEMLPGYKNYEVQEYTFLRMENGLVQEKHTVYKDFDFENVPKDADEALKKILEDFEKQRN